MFVKNIKTDKVKSYEVNFKSYDKLNMTTKLIDIEYGLKGSKR